MVTNASKRQKSLTLVEYLAFEEASPERHEFVAGEVYAFAGGTERHNRIALNIASLLLPASDSRGCRVMMSDVKLKATADIVYYPDIMVVRDQDDNDPLIKERPSLVVEVLSPNTRSIDLREKLFFYRQIASLDAFLIVEQDERKVYRHWRDDERLWWSETIPERGTIPIPQLGVELTLDDIYRNLPEPAAG